MCVCVCVCVCVFVCNLVCVYVCVCVYTLLLSCLRAQPSADQVKTHLVPKGSGWNVSRHYPDYAEMA